MYRSLGRQELEGLLQGHRARDVGAYDICLASADQNVFATAVKAAAA